jgi:HopA1 effector protein family
VSTYRALLTSALAAVQLHSPTSYSWFGRPNPPLPRTIRKAINPSMARAYLLYVLQLELYNHLYCPGAATPADKVESGWRRSPMPTPFLASLSAANTGVGSREPGWRVHSIEGDHVVVERHGLRLWMEPDEICPLDGIRPEPGVPLTIRLPKELLKLSPGFYVALGDEGLPPPGTEPVVRVYWNLVADAAPDLIRSATTRLNAARIPFNLKLLDEPDCYTRCDAAVLYVPRRCYPAVAEVVTALYHELRAGLLATTPAFTKQLAPGLALAEDPGDGDSFGMHRCRLLAEGIIRAREQGRRSNDDRLAAVIACFTEAGIAHDRPYLSPGSADDYPLLPGATLTGAGTR